MRIRTPTIECVAKNARAYANKLVFTPSFVILKSLLVSLDKTLPIIMHGSTSGLGRMLQATSRREKLFPVVEKKTFVTIGSRSSGSRILVYCIGHSIICFRARKFPLTILSVGKTHPKSHSSLSRFENDPTAIPFGSKIFHTL
jgi:hypothetical protein